jgi:hypothetical protein
MIIYSYSFYLLELHIFYKGILIKKNMKTDNLEMETRWVFFFYKKRKERIKTTLFFYGHSHANHYSPAFSYVIKKSTLICNLHKPGYAKCWLMLTSIDFKNICISCFFFFFFFFFFNINCALFNIHKIIPPAL